MTPDELARICPDWEGIGDGTFIGTCRIAGKLCLLRDCRAFKYLKCVVYQAKFSAKVNNLGRDK